MDWTVKYRDIITDALKSLSRARRRTTNLYLDTVPCMKSAVIGPEFQNIRARWRSILVFADDDPMANFGHPCRYRFYDEKTHVFLYEVAAQFPPHLQLVPGSFKAFYEPVRPRRRKRRARGRNPPAPTPPSPPTAPPPAQPAPLQASRERYAILFSGSSDRRHLNDLEYCYRMLTGYGFKRSNICVLSNNNTRTIHDGSTAKHWPEESDLLDTYKIPIPPPAQSSALPCFPADRDGFKAACGVIAQNLKPQDLVFVHTNGHGGAFSEESQLPDVWLVSHNEKPYYMDEFCEDLAILPKHESLLIMMQQCYSGRFIAPVIAAKGPADEQIKAQRLSIACASMDPSHSNEECTFNMFTYGWVTAHLLKDPYGNPPSKVVDTGGILGVIEAREAYAYAASVNVAHPLDSPECVDVPEVAAVFMATTVPPAGDIALI